MLSILDARAIFGGGRMDENAKEMPSGQLFKLASKKAIVCDQKPSFVWPSFVCFDPRQRLVSVEWSVEI